MSKNQKKYRKQLRINNGVELGGETREVLLLNSMNSSKRDCRRSFFLNLGLVASYFEKSDVHRGIVSTITFARNARQNILH